MKQRNKLIWRLCIILVLLIMVVGYTPIMIPKGEYKPMIFGIPYSLWFSFLMTTILVLLTYVGSKVHPGSDEGKDES